jgi:SAM-dependent methyltransferase
MSKKKSGIYLDVCCVPQKQKSFFGMYRAAGEEVDLVHDFAALPYPLDDASCLSVLASDVVHRIPPDRFIAVIDEWWRLLIPDGRLLISAPYGVSDWYLQDPGACKPVTERTWWHFDPTHVSGLYQKYKPQPWRIIQNAWNAAGTIEVVLEKLGEVDRVRALRTKKG